MKLGDIPLIHINATSFTMKKLDGLSRNSNALFKVPIIHQFILQKKINLFPVSSYFFSYFKNRLKVSKIKKKQATLKFIKIQSSLLATKNKGSKKDSYGAKMSPLFYSFMNGFNDIKKIELTGKTIKIKIYERKLGN